jgi:uncharacterized protein (TIGR03089 family)
VTDPLLPATLLASLCRADPAQPLLTWYSADGGRVELSVATLANWVAKTAGLLVDEIGVGRGDVVSVRLPAHWLGPVWAQSVWTAGCRLVLGEEQSAAVVVVDAASAQAGVSVGAAELVVVSTAPFAGSAGAAVPPGAYDYGRDVLGHPDRFDPAFPAAVPDPLAAEARLRAAELPRAARVLVPAAATDEALVRDALLVPLLVDGSAVVVATPGTADLASLARMEKALTTDRW